MSEDEDPMLGTEEERDTYMATLMSKVQEEADRDRAALRSGPKGVADVGTPVLIGGKGMQNGIVSSI